MGDQRHDTDFQRAGHEVSKVAELTVGFMNGG